MAPKSLAQQLAELEDPTPRDFDPEDLDRGVQSSDEEGGKAVDADAGREHYQAVGKGKLRKQDPVALGKQYAGSKVSRQALEAESDDDPFAARSSDEEDEEEDDEELGSDEDEEDISDDEASEEETARPAKSAGKKAKKQVSFDDMDTDGSDEMDGFEDEDEDEDDEEDDEDEDEFPSDEDDEDEDEDDDSDASDDEPRRTGKTDDREELRKLMASDQKTIAATISQAAKADAAKGKAVKQQRATFDALLNTRIKLQKGLTVINQLSLAAAQQQASTTTDEKSTPNADADADATPEPLDGEAIKSAESAALALWSTLEDLRLALADAHHKQQQGDDDSKKRKRPAPVTPATSSASLWKRMTALEAESLAHRRAVLDKWSQKVRGATAATTANARGKLLSASSASQTISTVLDAQVATETAAGLRAVKRARTATTTNGTKSTTTTKAAAEQPDEPAEPLYDDTVFYQTLLRELVEQRISSSDAITNGLDTLHLQLPSRLSAVHPVTGMRKDKVKRDVDTRASKGRKMKFEIHEKLQNFMAPEDRGAWTRHAREEFFASLLGNTASGMLREEDEDEDVDAAGEDSDVDREEGGLRLFRN
ncbi:hypothetical protein ASPACDRAFT_1890868 [Aspergillus aculeatus ATCC 16872]|uniref:Protein BFR2 n=1 Tax=Aspergillus aculeatus (strain ATCC 16872 / CBS 172.66 / WB 5094) TaxID=690307 RepID=A0A1L9WJX2_ASPA1|nr:uncharacterized protein ASPACDRAFT_1890868 [Aspergillus aculeatus ATCC 16872]OJJ96459.1 hypothetical protein ASPACDRAFT_1890868 [Aspergillus aculeatus ATCC 16872]